MVRFIFPLLALFSTPLMAVQSNFEDCARWINVSTEITDAGARTGRGGMVNFNLNGSVNERKPRQLGPISHTGNRSIYQSRELPELQSILSQSENRNFRETIPRRDEVTVERDSSGQVTKLIISRAINLSQNIRGTIVPAYEHIQDISFSYDSRGCYPVSRNSYRKVGDLQEPDLSESFTFENCAELARIKELIGYETQTVDGTTRQVLNLPELNNCRRLMSAVLASRATTRYSIEELNNFCSESTYSDTGRTRREAIDTVSSASHQCETLNPFIPRPESGAANEPVPSKTASPI